MGIETILIIPIIMYSIILHEIAHGYSAFLLGDDTAKMQNRLSLNPLNHIDKFGTILLPALLLLMSGGKFAFGYAKPVPINPYNFRSFKKDSGITAAAGPLTNLLIAITLSLILRLIIGTKTDLTGFEVLILRVLISGISINLFLMLFNLIPFPPLDGSKVLGAFLSDRAYMRYTAQERLGMSIFMGILFINYIFRLDLFRIFEKPLMFMLRLLTGLNF